METMIQRTPFPHKTSIPLKPLKRVKMITLGEGAVGKTCLIKRYCEGKFISKYLSTIGIDYGVKKANVNGEEIKVNIWDLSGRPEFLEVRNEFYRDAQGGLLVFDVHQRDSFDKLDTWLAEANKFGAQNVKFILVGNKIDITGPRAITKEEARQWGQFHGFQYYEASAKTGQNLSELFGALFAQLAAS
eukprot:GCRY01001310.1.p1 GENE.GCRY01001310.1~~GCRY01001310.1.p1  ORF type:complete len:188 (-),score=1.07 GCRY01001310.1:76-639(-)